MAIEEELSLNVSAAIDAIGQMAQNLQDALTGFFVAFDDALKQLSASSIPLNFEAEMEGGQAQAFQDQEEVQILANDADASGAASDIESAIGGVEPSFTASVDGDASGLQSSIQTATEIDESPELVVNVGLDQGAAQADADNLRDKIEEPIVATLEVDGAEQIDGVAQAVQEIADGAESATDSLTGTGDATEKVADGASKAAEETKKAGDEAKSLEDKWQAVAVVSAQGATAFLAAIAGSTAALAASAIESEGVLVGFNQQLGALAPRLLNENIGDLNMNLAELAQYLGSSDEAALGVSQRFALMGQTAGATNDQIAEANSNLFSVAAAIRSVNPAMGTLDEIANRLTTGFQRGGTALARLGLTISTEEIRVRAAEMTMKGMNAEFTRFELAAAGAQLAAERFGPQIKENVEKALENPIIALARFREIIGDTLETIGKPLIAPFLEYFEKSIPFITGFSELLANITVSALPLLGAAFDSIGPIILEILDSFQEFGENLEPLFESLGDTVRRFAQVISEVLPAITAVIDFSLNAIVGTLKLFADLLNGLNPVLTTVAVSAAAAGYALKGLIPLISANPVLAAAAAFTVLAGAIYQSLTAADSAPKPFEEFVESILANVSSIELLSNALDGYEGKLAEFIATEKLLADTDIVSALAEVGLSADFLARSATEGITGIRKVLAALASSGEITIKTVNKVGQYVDLTADEIAGLTNEEVELALATTAADGAAGKIIGTFNDLQNQSNDTAKAILNESVATGVLDSAIVEAAKTANTDAVTGFVNYRRALEQATAATAELRAEQLNQPDVQAEFKQLAENVKRLQIEAALGALTLENYGRAMEETGLSSEFLENLISDVTEEVQTLSSTVAESIPSLVDSFSALGDEGVTTESILSSFEKSLAATDQWTNKLIEYANTGKTALLQIAASIGPERTALLTSGYSIDEQNLNDHLQRLLLAETKARVDAEVASKIWFIAQRGLFTGNYDTLRAVLAEKAFFGPLTREDVDNAINEINEGGPEVAAAVTAAGGSAQDAWRAAIGRAIPGDADYKPFVSDLDNLKTEGEEKGGEAGAATGEAIINSAAEAIQQGSPEVAAAIVGNYAAANEQVLNQARSLGTNAGREIVSASATEVRNNQVNLVAAINGILINSVDSTREATLFLGFFIAGGIGRGIFDQRNLIGSEIVNAFTYIVENYSDEADLTGWYLGDALSEGLKRGLRDSASSVAEIAAQIIRDAEIAAKDEAESDSPSKVWERLGRDLVSGLTNGLRNSSFLASNAAAGVINQATPAAAAAGGNNISISVPVTISGNVDPALGTEIGGRAAAEISRVLRLEAMVS